MKTISTQVQITSVRSRADGSLGLSLVTPELSVEEKVEFMSLHNLLCNALFKPEGAKVEDLITVDKAAGSKTPSQRLRAVLYVLWEQKGKKGLFEQYYNEKMDTLIDLIKKKLI